MIKLHRLSQAAEPFYLNPDLIERIDASPDCHLTLTTGNKLTVSERPEEIVRAVRAWRADVLAQAMAGPGVRPGVAGTIGLVPRTAPAPDA
jgi:uncharacterized protein YlzI (FlbEa/FlbD family)